MPAMRETWVRFPGGEDPLEKEMANHSSTVAWKIPQTEEPGGLQVHGITELHMTEHLHSSLRGRYPQELKAEPLVFIVALFTMAER